MFTQSAHIYDAIYESFHDFAADTERLNTFIEEHRQTEGTALLDVACGTGAYLAHLCRQYTVEGLDLDAGMLAIARQRLPDLPLHQADMADFDLGRQFDVLVCLGSSIGYVKTVPRLRQTLQNFSRHVAPGGVVVVEPWFAPEVWEVGRLEASLVDRPDLKIARLGRSDQQDRISTLDLHYLVATSQGIKHLTERHELGLFTHSEYLAAFGAAGLAVTHDTAGLIGRGLYIGVRR